MVTVAFRSALAVVLGAAGAPTTPVISDSGARQAVSLDGGGWTLTLDPANPATQRIKAAKGKVAGAVELPGAWEAQGFGEETTTMQHQYIGVGVYSRTVTVPPAFTASLRQPGATVWLVVQRIQRAATVTAGGTLVGRHVGYLSPFEGDVTQHITEAGQLNLSIAVDAQRRKGLDGLQGEEDLETDGTGLGGWGGIGGHVTLDLRGVGWIMHPHVRHKLSSSGPFSGGVNYSASVNVSIEVGGQSAGTGFQMRVTLFDPLNKTVSAPQSVNCPDLGSACTGADATLFVPALWSPRSPMQHTAKIELISAGGSVIDSVSVRFGVRQLEVIGYHWKLNGEWLYLHGYGDDSIYPMFTSPPLSRSFYKGRLQFAHGLGMNFVRHHSHILPIEYFDAACEVGVMVSAEFPIAYGKPHDCDSPRKGGCDPL
jgi:beta-galactosidase/beta-glucuronidase